MSEMERWEARFAAPGYLFGTAPNAFLKSKADLLKSKAPGKALSLADGEARNGVFMAEQGLDVLSLDISPIAQDKARKLAKERGVALRTELGDLATWKWPAAEFDAIVGIFFQFSTPEVRPGIFAGIKQALKPGGLLLIQGYRPKQLEYKTGGPSEVERLYTRELLQQAFGDFAALDIREHDDVISEGTGHAGMSALIDLVGRK
jgi:cyclopropane fatty-acyl-phospholipid synthase-like methyltransferase